MNESEKIVDIVRRVPMLPPYDAALLYRDAVRLEAEFVTPLIENPIARGKYLTYWKRFALAPPRRYFSDHNYARRLVPALDAIRQPRMEAVLDAACGNGFEAILFALHGKHVHANDISSARVAVTQARTRFYRSLLDDRFRVTVTSGNAIELAGSLPRFDVIYVQEAISHIHPAETFLREVATRLLTPRGRLIVSDSNSWNPVIRARISRQLWVERRTLRHFVEEQVDPETGRRYVMAEERLFSPPGISRAFHQAGLEVKQLSINGFAPPLLLRRPRSPFAMFVDDFAARIPGLRNFGGVYTIVGTPLAPAPAEPT